MQELQEIKEVQEIKEIHEIHENHEIQEIKEIKEETDAAKDDLRMKIKESTIDPIHILENGRREYLHY